MKKEVAADLRPPAEHDATDPQPRAELFQPQVGRHLDQETADDEDSGGQATDFGGKAAVGMQWEGREADVHRVEEAHPVGQHDGWNEPPRHLGDGAPVLRRRPRSRIDDPHFAAGPWTGSWRGGHRASTAGRDASAVARLRRIRPMDFPGLPGRLRPFPALGLDRCPAECSDMDRMRIRQARSEEGGRREQ